MKQWLLIFVLCASLLAGDVLEAPKQQATRTEQQALLARVTRFAYQLQNFTVKPAIESDAQMLVIDPQTDNSRLTADEVASMKIMPDKSRRLVIAYLSIGEAEDYRSYWNKTWSTQPPAWLGAENPDWKGNFEVKYWDPGWQSVILGSENTSLDQILGAGFDGVYLDIVDGFEYWEEHGVPDAKTRMVDWVRKIATYSRAKQPGFLVIPQNGEALGAESGYLDLIDALGKEDLFFNGDKRQPANDTKDVIQFITAFQAAKKPVFLIEYPKKTGNQAEAYSRGREAGFVPLVTVRDLDKLIVTQPKEKSVKIQAR